MSNIGTYTKAILAFLGAAATTGAALMSQGMGLSVHLGLAMLAAACAVGGPVAVASNAAHSDTSTPSTPPVSLGVVPTTSSELDPSLATVDPVAPGTPGGSSPVLAPATDPQ